MVGATVAWSIWSLVASASSCTPHGVCAWLDVSCKFLGWLGAQAVHRSGLLLSCCVAGVLGEYTFCMSTYLFTLVFLLLCKFNCLFCTGTLSLAWGCFRGWRFNSLQQLSSKSYQGCHQACHVLVDYLLLQARAEATNKYINSERLSPDFHLLLRYDTHIPVLQLLCIMLDSLLQKASTRVEPHYLDVWVPMHQDNPQSRQKMVSINFFYSSIYASLFVLSMLLISLLCRNDIPRS
jgi:hypothetical protein